NGEEQTQFEFSIDKTAPINTKQLLTFSIAAGNGESWTKQITISINAPEKIELHQNYPNPFNPSTTLSFVISQLSFVSLKVYNVLGQEVITLVDGEKLAGYHEVVWSGENASSGVYFYKLEVTGISDPSNSFVQIKKMLLAK
ncbi:MAG: T9SS type A sorting domain-containing protein, partial [Ignavibacteriales bacterium]|nr:T9SS type A sorting domain-containing protein [Ignavibacteriales bacterium]